MGPKVVAGVVSILVGDSLLGTGVGFNVEVGVDLNGAVDGVGVGVGLTSIEGRNVVAGVGSFVEDDDKGVGTI